LGDCPETALGEMKDAIEGGWSADRKLPCNNGGIGGGCYRLLASGRKARIIPGRARQGQARLGKEELAFLEFEDVVEDAVGYLEFRKLGQRDFAAVAQVERDNVRVTVEASALLGDVVGGDHIRALAL